MEVCNYKHMAVLVAYNIYAHSDTYLTYIAAILKFARTGRNVRNISNNYECIQDFENVQISTIKMK